MLEFANLALRRGPRLLFRDATLQIHPGWKVGVTGVNGCGKSSLFSLLLGELPADRGDWRVPREWVTAHVAQETPRGPRPALEYVLDGDAELRALQRSLQEAEKAGDGSRLARLHARLEAIDGYRARSRAERLLHGLGFAPGDVHQPVERLSGGWRMRLNLARALFCRSDLLLLDEPTNHLDLDAVIWLEGWLQRYRGTLLLISHDREFLDAVCGHILHLEQQRLTLFRGDYSAFERTRAERLAHQRAACERQQREIAHIRSYVERFRAKASKARQAQSRLKALERMERIAPAHVDSPFRFRFLTPRKLPRPLLRLHDASCGHHGRPVVSEVELVLSPGDRLGLLGSNGAGKSTLMKLLAGELAPLKGRLERARDLTIGYFAQHQLDQLQPQCSPLEHLLRLDPQLREQEARDYLGGFGFGGDQALQPVAPFSGGERSRLALALIVRRRPNLLLLDEPTNHLDLEMRQALALALQAFKGALVLVSHDRHLLRTTTDRLLVVDEGRLHPFEGALDDYPAWLSRRREKSRPAGEGAGNPPNRKEERREAARRRKALQPLKKRVQEAEARLEAAQKQRAEVERSLADNQLYHPERKEELKTLLARKRELDRRCEAEERAWLEAAEALEEAEGAVQ